jgi:hypothetical protein
VPVLEQVTTTPNGAASYAIARFSPDGKRLALEIDDQNNDIWTEELKTRVH